MNYPLRTGLIDYFSGNGISTLEYAITDVLNNAPKRIRDMQMNLLSTHDTERIISLLGSGKKDGAKNSYLATFKMDKQEYNTGKNRLMLAYAAIATLPGIPSIYYGDEVGLEGYKDPFNRRPFPWGREDHQILEHYRKMGAIRRKNSVYKDGEFNLIALDKDMFVFERTKGKFKYITFINISKNDIRLCFGKSVREIYSNKRSSEFTVHTESFAIFKSKADNEMFIKEEEL
jgi:glycosidase